ncbi:hypothetical protein GTY41_42995 [Streptomyces sp. SID685]|uniref:hypothetical protein n=1 Tax=Streptomyces TaxID=1883 RepID=UPI00137014BD|nr:hypothetical protein [Streptomyces sp. SID685]MYR91501.1 hypothetical protein [Streptomyces sp. SID685]
MAGPGRGRRVLLGVALAVPEQVPCAEAPEFGGGKRPQGAGADVVTVNVTYEGPDRALVRFSAFTG